MKIYKLLLFTCVVSVFVSSCSRFENITVSKRHYRGGYYVDFGGKKASGDKTNATSVEAVNVEMMPTMQAATVNENPPAEPGLKTITAKAKRHTFTSKVYADASAAPVTIASKEETIKAYIAEAPSTEAAHARNATDAPDWVIIVFAILIPPLGVGLKFGIVDKFWISLLLTLLFWLPGAIYSVIVVTQK